MSRWVGKYDWSPQNSHWRRYSALLPGWRRPWRDAERVDPQPNTALQRDAKSLIKSMKRAGNELRGPCPACQGSLIVGPERWRCLGCGAQEIAGSDIEGFKQAFLSDSPT